MTTKTTFTRASLAALFGLVALGTMSAANAGTHADGHGGAVCKGGGSCLVLELDCKGTYTDATQSNGEVYGHCTQTAQVKPGFKNKLQATQPQRKRKFNR